MMTALEKIIAVMRQVGAGLLDLDAPLPGAWLAYCGRYGPDFIPVIVSERHGHLYAMTENMVDYRLTPINRHACAFPPGMYAGEQAVFLDLTKGRPCAIDFANVRLSRRNNY